MIFEKMSNGDISAAEHKLHSEVEIIFSHFLEFYNANKQHFKVPENRGWNRFLADDADTA